MTCTLRHYEIVLWFNTTAVRKEQTNVCQEWNQVQPVRLVMLVNFSIVFLQSEKSCKWILNRTVGVLYYTPNGRVGLQYLKWNGEQTHTFWSYIVYWRPTDDLSFNKHRAHPSSRQVKMVVKYWMSGTKIYRQKPNKRCRILLHIWPRYHWLMFYMVD